MRRPPGRLWLFFYGRQRRGVPWLLAAVAVAVVAFAITFALPGGADFWRSVAPLFIGALLAGAVVAAIVATLIPRSRR